MKLQKVLSYVRRAVDDYNMIEDGDKIAVGVSGGKDSITLLVALKALKRFYPKKFEIEAVSVSLGFEDMNFYPVQRLCDELEINYTIVKTDIGEIIFKERKEKNPCSLCAKMRKGALNNMAEKLSCNKVALGHNKDDVIQTLFMAMFYEGRIYTFSPVTFLDRKKIYSIRPLIYISEKDVISFVKSQNLPIVKNECKADGNTKREEIKKFVLQQVESYDHFQEKIFGAIKRSEINGWK